MSENRRAGLPAGVTSSGGPPSVDRPEGSKSVLLTLEGLRDAKVRDRGHTHQNRLQGPQAARLWRRLGERFDGPREGRAVTKRSGAPKERRPDDGKVG